ncbi:MAG TPA: hypothetical protein VMX75_16305, partial [Spirochaetia bacterium]|nr:hypothetical protein [Spirochaetia bacterium]
AGFANGLGSGINMVLSTDLAPKDSVGEFLGIWRLISDVGMSGGPLLIGFVAQAFSMLLASLFTGGLGVAGAAIMVFLVSETLPGAKPAGKPVRPRSFNG